MPYPAKLTLDTILDAAAALVDDEGVGALSLRSLAARLEVRAPSLYKYVPDKESLLRALSGRFFRDLSQAAAGQTTLAGLGSAYRSYALAHPRRYAVLFRPTPEAEQAPTETRLQAAEPLLALATLLAPDHPLPTARAIWSYLHGAVSLELQFQGLTRPGLDTSEAFERGLDALARGLAMQRMDAGGA